MSGYDQFNFPAFHAAAQDLRSKGYIVLSPAEKDEESGFDATLNSLDGFDWKAAFSWDLLAIIEADAVVVLPGWEKSKGANIEVAAALFMKMNVILYPTMEIFDDFPC